MIGILNYNMGNIRSVRNALDYLDLPNQVISDPKKISSCDRIILPGVGAFKVAIATLTARGFRNELLEFGFQRRRPILGICLGMQLLLEHSTEGGIHSGLALVPGEVLFFGSEKFIYPIPHVGWNEVHQVSSSSLLRQIPDGTTFYFVHSYYCKLKDRDTAVGVTDYGIDFDSVLENENVYGCQFHPEKSQNYGLSLLRNFGKV